MVIFGRQRCYVAHVGVGSPSVILQDKQYEMGLGVAHKFQDMTRDDISSAIFHKMGLRG
jgi:hypothetical protein